MKNGGPGVSRIPSRCPCVRTDAAMRYEKARNTTALIRKMAPGGRVPLPGPAGPGPPILRLAKRSQPTPSRGEEDYPSARYLKDMFTRAR